jgi:hypothetical protein
VGASVSFQVGGVNLGSTQGQQVVSPVDLVDGGTPADAEVANRVRFLMMLDSDGDPANGIQISEAVRQTADDWGQPDFAASNFDGEISTIQAEVVTADGRSATLPSASQARSHLRDTLHCVYAGAFKGTFDGDDSGRFGFLAEAASGDVQGIGFSQAVGKFTVDGEQALSLKSRPQFVSGVVSTGASFRGTFTDSDSISGTWRNGGSGPFTGSRIGGALDAVYRFTGEFSGDDYGLFSFDIDEAGNVVGVAYSVQDDELSDVTGTLNGDRLNAQTDQGTDISATIDTAAGTISNGTWTWSGSGTQLSGTFEGDGCRLN